MIDLPPTALRRCGNRCSRHLLFCEGQSVADSSSAACASLLLASRPYLVLGRLAGTLLAPGLHLIR